MIMPLALSHVVVLHMIVPSVLSWCAPYPLQKSLIKEKKLALTRIVPLICELVALTTQDTGHSSLNARNVAYGRGQKKLT